MTDPEAIDHFWVCYGNYRGKRIPRLFYNYYNATTKRYVKELTFRAYIAKGIKDICGYDKTTNDIYKQIVHKSQKNLVVEAREPEEIINNIKSKLRGTYGHNEPSGEAVT